MAVAFCKKEEMTEQSEPSASGAVGHVFLDVLRKELHCLNARARALHSQGVPFLSTDLSDHPAQTLSGDVVTAADLPLAKAWSEGRVVEAVFLLPDSTGPSRKVSWTASPILDADGQVVAVVGAVSMSAPDPNWQTLAGLAHDLRTPLQALKLLLTLLERQAPPQPEAADVLARIQASANRALEIGQQLLEYCSGPAVTGRAGKNDWFPLEPFLHDLAAEQRVAAQHKALTLNTDFGATRSLETNADRQRLGRLLSNLLSNAVRYTSAGRVEFKAAWQGPPAAAERALVLSVIDTGAGISVEEQESIFQPFERGKAGKEGDSGGSGLGLAIVDRLVDELGFKLEVYSEYGRGSAFHLSVPDRFLRGPDAS